MDIKIDDCTRIEQSIVRLEEVKKMFEAAFSKAQAAVDLAKYELSRPFEKKENLK